MTGANTRGGGGRDAPGFDDGDGEEDRDQPDGNAGSTTGGPDPDRDRRARPRVGAARGRIERAVRIGAAVGKVLHRTSSAVLDPEHAPDPGRGPACVARAQISPRYALRTVSSSRRSPAGPLEDDIAGLEDVAAVGDVQGLEGVLLDEQDRRALAR